MPYVPIDHIHRYDQIPVVHLLVTKDGSIARVFGAKMIMAIVLGAAAIAGCGSSAKSSVGETASGTSSSTSGASGQYGQFCGGYYQAANDLYLANSSYTAFQEAATAFQNLESEPPPDVSIDVAGIAEQLGEDYPLENDEIQVILTYEKIVNNWVEANCASPARHPKIGVQT